jgi:hypothetical protein
MDKTMAAGVYRVGAAGREPGGISRSITAPHESDAHSDALPTELAQLNRVWSVLPREVRAEILRLANVKDE